MFLHAHPFSDPRRQFLLASCALASNLIGDATAAAEAETILLEPTSHDLFRVRVEMDVEGNVNVPKNALASRKSELKLPLKSDAVFDYEERFHRSNAGGEGALATTIERYYHEAHNQSRINRREQTCQLRESVRETVVRRDTLPEVIYAVDDFFHQDELELLRLPASSVAVDRLLPTGAVKEGSKYVPSGDAVASVLNLTSVVASDVRAEVASLTPSAAKIHFRGKVDGSVEGVPTVIRTIGKLTFDRFLGTCTWLAMAVHETREIGKAEPGFDVAATIKMIRKPLKKTMALSPQVPQLDPQGPIPSNRLYVDLQSSELGISTLMDRRWRMMSDVPGAAMMRMIENDRSVAQCDFRSLVALEAGNPWTLEAFQADVQRTLGEQLSELVEADERDSETGLRVLRVTAHGSVEGVPIQWVVLHFSEESGRRVLATFTMEGENMQAFAGADIQMANSLRFVAPAPRNAEEMTATGRSDADVAKVNSGEDSKDEVQSASDLR